MVKSRQKGNRTQLKAIRYLEDAGFLVNKVEVGGRFEKVKDLFGLFDLCAIRTHDLFLVQVTSNTPHTHKKYLEFSKNYDLDQVTFAQFVWYDKPKKPRGWKFFWYTKGKQEVEDFRRKPK